uniref:Uncharacterized protein n=1 Tax=Clastoptera arizonana TaxID=38151 RepID=A0A1B6CQF6_9HEMI
MKNLKVMKVLIIIFAVVCTSVATEYEGDDCEDYNYDDFKHRMSDRTDPKAIMAKDVGPIISDTSYYSRGLLDEFKELEKNPDHKLDLNRRKISGLVRRLRRILQQFAYYGVKKTHIFYKLINELWIQFSNLKGIEKKSIDNAKFQLKTLIAVVDEFAKVAYPV